MDTKSFFERGTRHYGPLLLPWVILNSICPIQVSKSYKTVDMLSIKKQSVLEETDIHNMVPTWIKPVPSTS